MPQFEPQWFATQIFWLAVTFIALYFILSRLVVPRISAVIGERADRISGDLESAETARAEAEAVTQAYEQTLARARAEAHAAVAKANQEMAAMAARRQAEFASQLAARTADAERRIDALRIDLSRDIRDIAAETAFVLAAKLTGTTPKLAALDRAVDDAMARTAP
jgi:F-type H+-transporting ATPase subunit b